MESIGQQLKAARERKGVTASQAAAATHMKVQHVEALERDDYSRLSVPTYAKGFLKIYAEYLGLDPVPLLRDYTLHHGPSAAAAAVPEPPVVQPAPSVSVFKAPRRPLPVAPRMPAIPPEVLRQLALGAGGVVVVVLLLLAIRHGCQRAASPAALPPAQIAITNPAPRPEAVTGHTVTSDKQTKPAPWVIVNEPPPPYYKRATTP